MKENWLERVGILNHRVTAEEMYEAGIKSRQLTADFLRKKIDLPTYRAELDKLPKLNLRGLAQELGF